MLYREICRILGLYILGFTLVLLIPLAVSFYYEIYDFANHPQPHVSIAFLETIAVSLTCAGFLYMIGYKSSPTLYRREGIAAVVLIWLITPALAGLPFWFSGTLSDPLQAYFEATAGLTTTGSSVLTEKRYDPNTGQEIPIKEIVPGVIPTTYEYYGTVAPVRDPTTGRILVTGVEAISKGLLFWRCFLQWLGGVGVVVLFVAILPALGIGGKLLIQAEITGPIKDAMTPRIKETAIQLWKIYCILTVFEIAVLWAVEPLLPWLDTITIAFSSLSTGGFSIKNEGIAFYHNPTMEWMIVMFMLMGSINFSLYYAISKGNFYKLYEPEFILFLTIIVLGSFLAVWILYSHGDYDITQAIRDGVFQITSATSSSGYYTANYNVWPYAIQVILLIMMYIGGMSGSTSGGMKVIRIYMIFRIVQYKVESLFHPEKVRNLIIGNRVVDTHSSMMVISFFAIIMAFSALGTLVYVFDRMDLETAVGLVACMINNTGMSFRAAGPLGSCAFMSDFSLVVSCILMIMGRLEFFAVLAMLIPSFWRQDT